MQWLTTIRNSPITKIILMLLTLLLGGGAAVNTARAARNASLSGDGFSAIDTQAIINWLIPAVVSAVGAWLTGPSGLSTLSKVNSKWKDIILLSKDPNMLAAGKFQAWDNLSQLCAKSDQALRDKLSEVGVLLIQERNDTPPPTPVIPVTTLK